MRILPFSDTRPTSFSVLGGFYLIPVMPWIYPFIGIHADSTLSDSRPISFSVVARILPDPSNASDFAIYRYSRGFYPFPIPDRSVFWYSHRFYLIPIVPQILPFIGLHADSTIFLYPISQFFLYSHGFDLIPVVPWIYYL